MSATYEYGARGDMPPVKLTWHQGEDKPEIWQERRHPAVGRAAVCSSASKGMLLADYGKHVLLPEKEFAGFKRPPQTIPRSRPATTRNGSTPARPARRPSATSSTPGWLTEANHLGNVAYRAGKKLEWDAAAMKATNAPEADRFLKREYRKGWTGIL